MNQAAALEKRIRRRVIGPAHRFTVIVQPGLEPLAAEELRRLPAETGRITVAAGEVRFSGRLDTAMLANLHLRTASRILLPVADIRAERFDPFQAKAAEIPWELYLAPGATWRVRVTTRHCRLHHSGALAERVSQAIAARIPKASLPAQPAPEQQIFVRGRDDRFTLSIDMSGELLYQRGIKTHGGRAPIRETLAAGILMMSAYDSRRPLIDPMCGSGTFSLEAAMIALKVPPGLQRRFAFMAWPAFRPARWEWMRRNAEATVERSAGAPILASDQDAAACLALGDILSRWRLDGAVQVVCRDFFDLQPVSGPPGLIVLNPPFGHRLETPDRPADLMKDIWAKLESDFSGWRLAMLQPGSLPKWIARRAETVRTIGHGGLRLTLYIGPVPQRP